MFKLNRYLLNSIHTQTDYLSRVYQNDQQKKDEFKKVSSQASREKISRLSRKKEQLALTYAYLIEGNFSPDSSQVIQRKIKNYYIHDLKSYYYSAKKLEIDSQVQLTRLRYFKNIKHLSLRCDKQYTMRKIPGLKKPFGGLTTLNITSFKKYKFDKQEIKTFYDMASKTMTIDSRIDVKSLITRNLNFFLPGMRKLIITLTPLAEVLKLDLFHRTANLSDLWSVLLSNQHRLKYIEIKNESYVIEKSILKRILMKYHPFIELNIYENSYASLINDLAPFSFYFIQTRNHLIINMANPNDLVPKALVDHIPIHDDNKLILYARKIEPGKIDEYVYLSRLMIQKNPYLYGEFDNRYFILDDGTIVTEEKFNELFTKKSYEYPEKPLEFKYSFKRFTDLNLEINKRVSWWMKNKDLISNLKVLSLKNLLLGKDPKSWSLIFEYINQNRLTLQEINLEFNFKEENSSTQDFFNSIIRLFQEYPKVTIRLFSSLEIIFQRFEQNQYSLSLYMENPFDQLSNFIDSVREKFERIRDFSLKINTFDHQTFKKIWLSIENFCTVYKLDLLIEKATNITNADINMMTSFLEKTKKIDLFYLKINEVLRDINDSIKKMHNKLEFDSDSHCKIRVICLRKYYYADDELKSLRKVNF